MKKIKICWLVLLTLAVFLSARAQQMNKDTLVVSNSKTCPCVHPVIYFKLYSAVLSKKALKILDSVSIQLQSNPDCTIVITGYTYTSMRDEDICQKRLLCIRTYLSERRKIDAERLYIDCIQNGGDRNTVEIKCR